MLTLIYNRSWCSLIICCWVSSSFILLDSCTGISNLATSLSTNKAKSGCATSVSRGVRNLNSQIGNSLSNVILRPNSKGKEITQSILELKTIGHPSFARKPQPTTSNLTFSATVKLLQNFSKGSSRPNQPVWLSVKSWCNQKLTKHPKKASINKT